jgi:hypothetical protein
MTRRSHVPLHDQSIKIFPVAIGVACTEILLDSDKR